MVWGKKKRRLGRGCPFQAPWGAARIEWDPDRSREQRNWAGPYDFLSLEKLLKPWQPCHIDFWAENLLM